MEDRENKTEEPTPKRLRDARSKGQVAKSGDLNAAVSFFGFTLLIGVLGPYVLKNGIGFMKKSLGVNFSQGLSIANLRAILLTNILEYLIFFGPFALIALVLGVIVNLIQVGFLFTLDPLKPDFKRLNPIEGFKNIFSKKSIFTLGKNIGKLILVFYMTYRNLSNSINEIFASGNIGTEKLFYFVLDFIKSLSMNIAIVILILGIVDYIFERREHRKNLRMSKQEIKDEYKEMEGSPEVKGVRRERQRQLAMGRMMENIEDSTVVVTNPSHIAVALRYDSERDEAPIVIAKGAEYIAKKIKEKAEENKIPIMEDKSLARAMYKRVEIGESVPVDLYKSIAEILALVYQIEERNKGRI